MRFVRRAIPPDGPNGSDSLRKRYPACVKRAPGHVKPLLRGSGVFSQSPGPDGQKSVAHSGPAR